MQIFESNKLSNDFVQQPLMKHKGVLILCVLNSNFCMVSIPIDIKRKMCEIFEMKIRKHMFVVCMCRHVENLIP